MRRETKLNCTNICTMKIKCNPKCNCCEEIDITSELKKLIEKHVDDGWLGESARYPDWVKKQFEIAEKTVKLWPKWKRDLVDVE